MAHPDGCFPPPTWPVPWFNPVKTKSILFSLRSLLPARSFGQTETGAPDPRRREEPNSSAFLLLACRRQIVYNKSEACLTQLAEYRFCKPNVIGSTPIVGLSYSPSSPCQDLCPKSNPSRHAPPAPPRPKKRDRPPLLRPLPLPAGRKGGGRNKRNGGGDQRLTGKQLQSIIEHEKRKRDCSSMVRAPPCHGGSCGFESRQSRLHGSCCGQVSQEL